MVSRRCGVLPPPLLIYITVSQMYTDVKNVGNPDLLVCILVVIKWEWIVRITSIHWRVFVSQSMQSLMQMDFTIRHGIALERKTAKMHLPKCPPWLQVPDVFSHSSWSKSQAEDISDGCPLRPQPNYQQQQNQWFNPVRHVHLLYAQLDL